MSKIYYTSEGLAHESSVNPAKAEVTVVPLDVLDFFVNNHVSPHVLENLIAYRRATQTNKAGIIVEEPLITTVASLEGVDLTGKTLRLWDANWEDSEWIYTSSVSTIQKADDDYYKFVFEDADLYDEDWDAFNEKHPDFDGERFINREEFGLQQIWVLSK